jgi:hypothetical protein
MGNNFPFGHRGNTAAAYRGGRSDPNSHLVKTGLSKKLPFDRGSKQSPIVEVNSQFDAARLNEENVGG